MKIFNDLSNLPGIGHSLNEPLAKLVGGTRIIDLLLFLPIRTLKRSLTTDLDNLNPGELATVKLSVKKYKKNYNRRSPFRVITENENGLEIPIDYFSMSARLIENMYPLAAEIVVSGKLHNYKGKPNFVHPDLVMPAYKFNDFYENIYPNSQSINNRLLLKLYKAALDNLTDLPEWQDQHFLADQDFVSFSKTIRQIHKPNEATDLDYQAPLVKRLAYDEFLAMQIALELVRRANKELATHTLIAEHKLAQEFRELLPFTLTEEQEATTQEIIADLESPFRMTRLIQGDVGCGKTVVAALAIIHAIAAGYQTAFMVPTGVLAEQQAAFFTEYFTKLGIKCCSFSGDVKGKKRQQLLAQIKSGEIDLVIGTHALFYEQVVFKNLALVVIDEQHRFGVEQRLKLIEKTIKCDFLLMSATPIPRTLALTLYGDLDISLIKQKPEGRQEIITRLVSNDRLAELISSVKNALERGEKIYWICPLVNESEKLDLTALEERYAVLKQFLPEDIITTVHGQMSHQEKTANIDKFLQGECQILLATTVVEVGVNVPDATIMIIEHAEHFGLAQLHQLRGRVGRGDKQASCVLLYDKNKISENSKQRLTVMRETNDGFVIAEEDLKIRGGGELLGQRQSGIAEFKIASLKFHFDLLKSAKQDAKLILEKDPNLTSQRGKALRILLQIFNYQDKLKFKNI